MRILVVDDNAINLKLLCEVLSSEGYDVAQARSSDEALSQLSKVLPDLLVLDIAMPGMDGLALTSQLRNASSTERLPIFIVTASAMKGDRAKAMEAGCNEYFTKPLDTRAFLHKVSVLALNKE